MAKSKAEDDAGDGAGASPPAFLRAVAVKGRDFIVFGEGEGAWARALLALGAASVEAWGPALRSGAPFEHPSLRWRALSADRAEESDILFRDVVCLGPPEEVERAWAWALRAEHALLAADPSRERELSELGFRRVGELGPPEAAAVFAKGMERPEKAMPATSISPAP